MSKHGEVTHVKFAHAARSQLLTTEDLALLLRLEPDSIRKSYQRTGAYYCLRPIKMPNGRLMWPADSLQQLSKGA